MPRPSFYPRMAMKADLSSDADIVEPSEPKKDSGWLSSEEPPHEFFNWFQNGVSQWVPWLDEREQALTGIASQNASDISDNADAILINEGDISDLQTDLANLGSDDIANESTVPGATVSEALDVIVTNLPDYITGLVEIMGKSGTLEGSPVTMNYYATRISGDVYTIFCRVSSGVSLAIDTGDVGADGTYLIVERFGNPFPFESVSGNVIQMSSDGIAYDGDSDASRPSVCQFSSILGFEFFLYNNATGYANDIFTGISSPIAEIPNTTSVKEWMFSFVGRIPA